MNNDNNFNIENKFINDRTPKKKKSKKIILILLLILLLGILGYLVYANKIAKENNKRGDNDYEEYDPNYKISNSNSNSNIISNSNSDITSNTISNSNPTTNNTSNITSSINSNINITSNIITSNSNIKSNTIKSNQTTSNSTSKRVAVTGIKLNKTSVSMVEGTSTAISATITPSNATDKTVIWSSSNTSVATVSNGKITAKKEGTTTITATSKDGNKKATCKVTVAKKNIPVTGGYWNTSLSSFTVYVGDTMDLTNIYKVAPSNATDKSIKWKVDNSSIASIDSTNNKLKGLKVGNTTLRVTLPNGKELDNKSVFVRSNPSHYRLVVKRYKITVRDQIIDYGYGLQIFKNGQSISNYKSFKYNNTKYTPEDVDTPIWSDSAINTSIKYVSIVDEYGYTVNGVAVSYEGF